MSDAWIAKAARDRLFPLGDLIAVESLRSLRGGWPQTMLDAGENGPEDVASLIAAHVPGARLLTRDGAALKVNVWRHRWHSGGPRGPVSVERGREMVASAVLAIRNAEWWEARTAAEIATECLLAATRLEGEAPCPDERAAQFRADIIARRGDGTPGPDYAYLPVSVPGAVVDDVLPSDMLRFASAPTSPPAEADPWEAAVECFLDLMRRHIIPVADLLDIGSLEGVQGSGWPEPLRRVGLRKLPKVALAALDRWPPIGREPVLRLTESPVTWATRWEWLAGSGEPRCILLPERGPRTVYALRNAEAWRDEGYGEAMALDILALAETDLRPISPQDRARWRYERSARPRMFSRGSPWRTPVSALLVERPDEALDFFGPEAAPTLADLAELRDRKRAEAHIRGLREELRRLTNPWGRRSDETPGVLDAKRAEVVAALEAAGVDVPAREKAAELVKQRQKPPVWSDFLPEPAAPGSAPQRPAQAQLTRVPLASRAAGGDP